MLEELENYYKENGILATSFTCAYQSQCKGDCAEFTGPKSAFVSSGYEKNDPPRLLFLSLDSGIGDKKDANRLPEAVRQQEEVDRDVLALHKNKHWYLTHELAWYIFRHFDKNIQTQEAKRYFAHANSAKCCMNKKQRKKAGAVLFKNCRKYLRGELQILSPKIIITQGNEAKEAIQSLCEKVIDSIDEFSKTIQLNNRPVFWLHTYHPNNWGAFHKQRDFDKSNDTAKGWIKYSGLMYKFVKENE